MDSRIRKLLIARKAKYRSLLNSIAWWRERRYKIINLSIDLYERQ